MRGTFLGCEVCDGKANSKYVAHAVNLVFSYMKAVGRGGPTHQLQLMYGMELVDTIPSYCGWPAGN